MGWMFSRKNWPERRYNYGQHCRRQRSLRKKARAHVEVDSSKSAHMPTSAQATALDLLFTESQSRVEMIRYRKKAMPITDFFKTLLDYSPQPNKVCEAILQANTQPGGLLEFAEILRIFLLDPCEFGVTVLYHTSQFNSTPSVI